MRNPRVSVICIFLNAERFIAEALDSVLAQNFEDFEVILVDDGSVDESSRIAVSYRDQNPGRVRYVDFPEHCNRGMSAARNLGLSVSSGEFVAFIDSDDRWRAGKLSDQVAIMDSMPDVQMVCGAVNYWRAWAGAKDRLVTTFGLKDRLLPPPAMLLGAYPLGTGDAPCPSDVLLRRRMIDRVGGFEEEFTGLYEDIAFFSKVLLGSPVWISGSCWLDYRRHPASSSARPGRAEYRSVRGRFLDWFQDYVEKHSPPGKERIIAAIQREMRGLERPLANRTSRRLRKTAASLKTLILR